MKPLSQVGTLKVSKHYASSTPGALKKTIQLIGEGIKNGSTYFPLRNYAAGLATTAAPKDYLGQVAAIYNDFVKRWRYVNDPHGVEAVVTSGDAILSQVLGADARPGQRGYGDCDDAAVAMGSLLMAIGRPVQIVTTAPPNYPGLFGHVFVRAFVPRRGWITVDPVLYPKQPLGACAKNKRLAIWDLNGNLLAAKGRFPKTFSRMSGEEGQETMENFPDYGLANYGLAGTDSAEPIDWSRTVIKDFGCYSNSLGMVSDASGYLMEYDEDDVIPNSNGLVVTKALELAPNEYQYFQANGNFRPGTVALSDDGDVYAWEPTPVGLGFFRKIFRRAKKRIKKFAKRAIKMVGGISKKLVKALPGGKYLLKIYGKVKKIAKKIVKPLAKYLGPLAKKLAPIAALIPGYGPAIAAGLYKTGQIAKVISKAGVAISKKTGAPKFKSGSQASYFKKLLAQAAKKQQAKGLSGTYSSNGITYYKAGSPEHAVKMLSLGL